MHKQLQADFQSAIVLDPTSLPRMVATLREGQGLQIVAGETLAVRYFRTEDLADLAEDRRRFHVVNHLNRDGAETFHRVLEEDFFPPGTPYSEEHQVRYFHWRALLWEIASVPAELRSCCVLAAKRTAMQLVDGIPQMIRRGNGQHLTTLRHRVPIAERFPLDGDHVFTLENLHQGESKWPRLVSLYFGARDD